MRNQYSKKRKYTIKLNPEQRDSKESVQVYLTLVLRLKEGKRSQYLALERKLSVNYKKRERSSG